MIAPRFVQCFNEPRTDIHKLYPDAAEILEVFGGWMVFMTSQDAEIYKTSAIAGGNDDE